MPPTIVQPRFMARFACLGTECPDTCCQAWSVDVDAETERRFRRQADARWRERFRRSLKRVVAGPGRRRQVIALRPDGRCPFLDEDRLCAIHRIFGEHALPAVCREFPRLSGGGAELVLRTGSLGCPPIARDVLTLPDALDETIVGDPLAPLATGRPTGVGRGELTPPEQARLRSLFVRILTAAGKPWPGRVALALVMLEDVARLDLRADPLALDALLGRFATALDTAPLGELEHGFAVPPETFLRVVDMIATAVLHAPETSAGRRQLIGEALRALGDGSRDPRHVARTYRSIAERRIAPELERRPYLAGNLTAALVLQAGFPDPDPARAAGAVWEAGFSLALWRLVLAGALQSGEPFEEAAVRSCYRLSRNLLHCHDLLRELRRLFESTGLLSPPVLAVLLR